MEKDRMIVGDLIHVASIKNQYQSTEIIVQIPSREDSNVPEIETETLKNEIIKETSFKIKILEQKFSGFISSFILEDIEGFCLLFAKKHISYYPYFEIFKDNKNLDKENIKFVVTSNILGTFYNLYDNGKSPNETKVIDKIRKTFGCIEFKKCFKGYQNFNKFDVYLPKFNQGYDFIQINSNFNLKTEKESNPDKILCISNKIEETNSDSDLKKFYEDGKKKDFELRDQEGILFMKMYKENENQYILTIYKGISIIQGLFISISSIDKKLAC